MSTVIIHSVYKVVNEIRFIGIVLYASYKFYGVPKREKSKRAKNVL